MTYLLIALTAILWLSCGFWIEASMKDFRIQQGGVYNKKTRLWHYPEDSDGS